MLNLAGFVPCSRVNGPGLRAVVWVQGCPFRCPGCWNPETLPFIERERVGTDILARRILDIRGLEGVTFSGGEPFAQPAGLAALGTRLQEAGLNVITFTGYRYERLRDAHRPDWDALLGVTDLLIDGPFISALRSDLPLRGSSNKRLIFLSERFHGAQYFDEQNGQAFEVHLERGGSIVTTGFPPFDADELKRNLSLFGLDLTPEQRERIL